MKTVKIRMNFHGGTPPLVSTVPANTPLGWGGGLSNIVIGIVGVPDDITADEVLRLFIRTSVAPDYEELNYRLPFSRLEDGRRLYFRDVGKINAETQALQ